MFDLILSLLGFMRPRSWRYGTRFDPTDLDNGYLGQQTPSPDTASRDYFRENSPSARKRGSQYDQQYNEDPGYFNGQEEVAANGATIFAVLALVAIVGVIALYAFVPAFHLQINTLLHR